MGRCQDAMNKGIEAPRPPCLVRAGIRAGVVVVVAFGSALQRGKRSRDGVRGIGARWERERTRREARRLDSKQAPRIAVLVRGRAPRVRPGRLRSIPLFKLAGFSALHLAAARPMGPRGGGDDGDDGGLQFGRRECASQQPQAWQHEVWVLMWVLFQRGRGRWGGGRGQRAEMTGAPHAVRRGLVGWRCEGASMWGARYFSNTLLSTSYRVPCTSLGLVT